ncbi:Hypothetical predicted protein [Octopus vulgaris]|uniref:Uncharacterized protein n=1 Tax=Octopus vulgaris TaxID=6645 RepID=A0AA36F3J4_OCTVU|nr:Hypothetical predicted protein [Octopus vulgaris]
MLFAAANVQYQDIRIDRSEWSRIRNRFHGNTNMEMTRVEFISDCFNEIMDDYMRMYQDSSGAIVFKKDSDPNVARAKTLRFETTCERVLPFMEETLQRFDGGNLFFMGEKGPVQRLAFDTGSPLAATASFRTLTTKYQTTIRKRYRIGFRFYLTSGIVFVIHHDI